MHKYDEHYHWLLFVRMAAKRAYMQPHIYWQYEQYSTEMLITLLRTCQKLYTHNRRAHPLRQYLTLKFPIQHEG